MCSIQTNKQNWKSICSDLNICISIVSRTAWLSAKTACCKSQTLGGKTTWLKKIKIHVFVKCIFCQYITWRCCHFFTKFYWAFLVMLRGISVNGIIGIPVKAKCIVYCCETSRCSAVFGKQGWYKNEGKMMGCFLKLQRTYVQIVNATEVSVQFCLICFAVLSQRWGVDIISR